MKITINTAVGDRDLCAWQPGLGMTWLQTRNIKHAERLARRGGGRLVARYTSDETRTNEALSRAVCPTTHSDLKRP